MTNPWCIGNWWGDLIATIGTIVMSALGGFVIGYLYKIRQSKLLKLKGDEK